MDSKTEIPTPEERKPLDPDLKGVWMQTCVSGIDEFGVEGMQPIAPDQAGIFILEPDNHAGILMDLVSFEYTEVNLFADGDSLVTIEVSITDKVEEAFKKIGIDNPDYTTLVVPQEYYPWFYKSAYKVINQDSLVVSWTVPNDTEVVSMGFRRMKDVEAEIPELTRGFFGDIWNGLKKACVLALDAVRSIAGYADQISDAIFVSSWNDFKPNWQNTKEWQSECWMKSLPKEMKIGRICIPGAHDSTTGTITALGVAVNADCQVLSVPELLNSGVRYLDVRTRAMDMNVTRQFRLKAKSALPEDVFNTVDVYYDLVVPNSTENYANTYHGPLTCDKPLASVFDDVNAFLAKNSSEFVILRVAYERVDIPGFDEEEDVNKSIELYYEVENQYKDNIIKYRPDMTLEEASGKILVINNNKPKSEEGMIGPYYFTLKDEKTYYNGHLAMKYIESTDSISMRDSTYSFWVQNFYEMQAKDAASIERKKQLIRSMAEDARTEILSSDSIAFDNQLNANTGKFMGLRCEHFAHIFNEYTYNMFVDNMKNHNDEPFVGGIYSMDYAGVENYDKFPNPLKTTSVFGQSCVWAIIERNFYGK